jgi:hypothetical protein
MLLTVQCYDQSLQSLEVLYDYKIMPLMLEYLFIKMALKC